MSDVLLVAAGAFAGAVLRYVLTRTIRSDSLGSAAAILTANVLGSFILGIIFAWDSAAGSLLVGIGFCGALTTFSTFSLDVLEFADAGRVRLAVGYVVLSTVACVVAVAAGAALGRACGLQ